MAPILRNLTLTFQDPVTLNNPKYIEETYTVLLSEEGQKIGTLDISLHKATDSSQPVTNLWYNLDEKNLPRPVLIGGKLNRGYENKATLTKLLELINTQIKARFDQPLNSDIAFVNAEDSRINWKKIWENLEKKGMAHRQDYRRAQRWQMAS